MVRRSFVRSSLSPLALAGLAVASAVPAAAVANELSVFWARGYDPIGTVNDVTESGGLDSSSAVAVSAGSGGGAFSHLVLGTEVGSGQELYNDFDADVTGTVSYGHISGSVTSYAASNYSGAGSSAYFKGSYVDLVTITNTALTGQNGVLTGSVLVDVATNLVTSGYAGVPDPGGSADVQWILRANDGYVNSNNQASAEYQDDDKSDPVSGYCCVGPGGASLVPAPPTVVIPITWQFVFGQPFDMGLEFTATSLAGARGFLPQSTSTASAQMNFLNTIAWQGITSVTLEDGVTPADFSIEAESGADYTAPIGAAVPAPAGLWLLGTGLAGLVMRRIGRRR